MRGAPARYFIQIFSCLNNCFLSFEMLSPCSRVAAARIFAFLVSVVTVAIILDTGHRQPGQPGDAPDTSSGQEQEAIVSTDAQHSDLKTF